MKIRVEIKSEIVGNSVFWEGDASDINKIRNFVAKDLAQIVVKDGISRHDGMWHVLAISDAPNDPIKRRGGEDYE